MCSINHHHLNTFQHILPRFAASPCIMGSESPRRNPKLTWPGEHWPSLVGNKETTFPADSGENSRHGSWCQGVPGKWSKLDWKLSAKDATVVQVPPVRWITELRFSGWLLPYIHRKILGATCSHGYHGFSPSTREWGTSKEMWGFHTALLLMAEILHQLIASLSHYLQGFIHAGWCRISAINRYHRYHRRRLFQSVSWLLPLGCGYLYGRTTNSIPAGKGDRFPNSGPWAIIILHRNGYWVQSHSGV